eukprot:7015252-Lingulodinium_polyedra.AAC.1
MACKREWTPHVHKLNCHATSISHASLTQALLDCQAPFAMQALTRLCWIAKLHTPRCTSSISTWAMHFFYFNMGNALLLFQHGVFQSPTMPLVGIV